MIAVPCRRESPSDLFPDSKASKRCSMGRQKSKSIELSQRASPTAYAPQNRTVSNGLDWDGFILGLRKTTKEFIENVLENIIESIVVTTIDGRLVFFNTFSEEMFGYRAEEVLNRHIAILGATEPDVLGHIRANHPFHGEISLKTKQGRQFPAHVRCVPLADEMDRPIAMVGVARDLTREKEKERADLEVARLKAFNENIIASLNDGIQIIDLNGTIRFVNTRLEDLLEYKAGELFGRDYSTLVAGEGHRILQDLLDPPDDVLRKDSFETLLVTKSGRKVPVLISASPFVEAGTVTGMVTAITDVSEMHRLKQGLFHSEKMSLIGTLASEVAHEINNPLGGLIMAVQMLTEDIGQGNWDPKAVVNDLAEIDNDARRCRKIVHKLLGFSRRVSEKPVLLDMNIVVEDSLLLVQRQAELDDISFSKNYDESIPHIRGNSSELQQVIINLVKNACDAMPSGGCIEVSTTWEVTGDGQWVGVAVADTGTGIPSEIFPLIFESFYTTKEVDRGTGLGLAVSKRIVEDHGGRITFKNREGCGAEFRLWLPAVTQAAR